MACITVKSGNDHVPVRPQKSVFLIREEPTIYIECLRNHNHDPTIIRPFDNAMLVNDAQYREPVQRWIVGISSETKDHLMPPSFACQPSSVLLTASLHLVIFVTAPCNRVRQSPDPAFHESPTPSQKTARTLHPTAATLAAMKATRAATYTDPVTMINPE